MAILFKSSSSGNDHVISNLELNLVEEHFAKGFRKAQLVDLTTSEDANVVFSDKFFNGKSDAHSLIAKIAFENYSVFQHEQLSLVQSAITELKGLENQCSGILGILNEANETLLTQQVAIFEVDITYKQ
ncbi:hypothetical protein QTV49_001825 [Vibrio vulnificus]|nr:hypothetical protein [Vibrio vulnificus]